ncbi:MAG: glycerophosphodiester phosphodiesterase [Hyphomicrobiaceae bacterium]|nr:glycerophosphodiester phosphodiesterase [Hyphomicrobiaceae bacterium]
MLLSLLAAKTAAAFDLQGHRGARGLMPENTLPAFEAAIGIGVTTLETDLALTKDGVLILAHDTAPNPDLTRDAAGKFLGASGAFFRDMTFAETQTLDVGRLNPASRYGAQWPDQKPVDGTRLPRLADLFALAQRTAPGMRFNIETKISPLKLHETASPEVFAAAVVASVREAGVAARVTVQSFDWRTLVALRRMAPDIARSCLTIDTGRTSNVRAVDGRPSPWLAGIDPAALAGSVPRAVQAAGCTTWSPFWRNLDAAGVAEAKALGLKVLPWTVNRAEEFAAVVDLGVDGLITDYPDRARAFLEARGIAIGRAR